jgi:S-adenosylmethionine:tRNA ribosyltransferase-isomerase
MTVDERDRLLESYDYDLPDEAVAQHPAGERGESRLLVYDRRTGSVREGRFSEIGSFLPFGSLLVANNSRVLPARIRGRRSSGGKVEFLLLSPLPLILGNAVDGGDGWNSAQAEGLLRSSKGVRIGERMEFGEGLELEVLHKGEYGRAMVRLHWKGDLAAHFLARGEVPLPPYIRRTPDLEDEERYQTVYAATGRLGSVAAPTAGLHFTPGLRDELSRSGHQWAEVTLYVGYGTFSPIRVDDVGEHTMHKEYVQVTEEAARAVSDAKKSGRPVVAVGTTTVRVLESVVAMRGGLEVYEGWTDLYIRPGFRFGAVDHLITNFHLPKSSLLVMVSAFAGRENVLSCYEQAKTRGMRFFSYGDAMFII